MYQDNDPRSWAYKRKYERPDLHWSKVVLWAAAVILASIAVKDILICCFAASRATGTILQVVFFISVCGFNLKKILIWCVKVYQHFAPISVRSMCRFEPSCSEYMILAIDKYGAVKGVACGINRVWKCSHKSGGFDYPQ